MSKRELYKTEMLVAAIVAAGGVITDATRMLNKASKTKITRKCLHDWIRKEPELKEAKLEAREVTLDLCEGGLIKLIKDGDRESIKYYTRCFGGERGFVERTRIEGGDKPIEFVDVSARDVLAAKIAAISGRIEKPD